jgi:hypothetical protein
VLDYLAEVGMILLFLCLLSTFLKKCPDNTVAIAHDDDLQLVEQMVRLRLYYIVIRRDDR